jgi:hypothetical protein
MVARSEDKRSPAAYTASMQVQASMSKFDETRPPAELYVTSTKYGAVRIF